MRKKLLFGVLAAAVTALVGGSATGVYAEGAQLWSVMVHFDYADGTSYDYPLARGAAAAEVSAILRDCGRSHRTGSVVRYHCYPVPE